MTDRLLLRRFTLDDLDDLAALHGDPEVMRFIDGHPVARAVVEERTLPEILAQYEELPEGLGRFVVVERESGDFLGWVSLAPPNSVGLEEYSETGLELGYRLRREAWGHGYATEGARELIRRGFALAEQPGGVRCDQIVATTMTVNAASRRVMERAGLVHVRTFFAVWPEYLAGAEHGDVIYALTRDAYVTGE